MTGSLIVPTLRYRNAPAAIDWLCRAFGFERHFVIPGPDDTIAHAQLTLGSDMVMLGSMHEDAYGRLVGPHDPARPATQSLYVIVPDADALHARAVAAGAEIVMPLATPDYGGRDFTCRDCEGHVWTFGTYDPWASTH